MRNLVLLSGGLDSTVLLASLKEPSIAVTFDYGQQHTAELDAAKTVAERYAAQHRTISIDATVFGITPLLGGTVPQYESIATLPKGTPETYVPARNTVFLSHALALAASSGANTILIGVTAEDASFPDCTHRYIEAFNALLWYATPKPMQILAPFQHWTKDRVVALGSDLKVDFGSTSSCYQAKRLGQSCNACEACLRREQALSLLEA